MHVEELALEGSGSQGNDGQLAKECDGEGESLVPLGDTLFVPAPAGAREADDRAPGVDAVLAGNVVAHEAAGDGLKGRPGNVDADEPDASPLQARIPEALEGK